ncbi:hypothetical protein L207DRAFT_638796 [Hyaloscypha variabilis F]|uniref:Infection structure specific protein n=1 Tax=Hyaloscypha variabilis (strain UAMH 11265 / GT02V1 / F) TaxID=1149755 RepID=A0A2J6R6W8_HYAVF|nr:hypothetical protein L207DRAFT_638796 [Hyaloscypha variabilis F]
MYVIKSLLVAVLATTTSATYFDGEALRREVFHIRQVSNSSSIATPYPTATASTNSSNACSSVLAGLATVITGLPTPTGALYSYLQTAATTLTDPCHLSVPSSIAPAFSTYESSVISFYSAHQSQLNSALSSCPSLTSLIENPVCSTSSGTKKVVKSTSTATVTRTATATATATATPSASVISTGDAGELSVSGAMMLVLGALGVVAVVL